MAFLEKQDFTASIHEEILNALTRDNDDVIEDNVSRTVDEMKAYMNGRYDTTAIFNATGDDRNKFIVRLGLSISIYYICLAHNPRKLTQTILSEFERAIETLEKIQSGKVTPEGLPVPEPEEGTNSGGPVQWGGMCPTITTW